MNGNHIIILINQNLIHFPLVKLPVINLVNYNNQKIPMDLVDYKNSHSNITNRFDKINQIFSNFISDYNDRLKQIDSGKSYF